jgi:BASS family bile acid:Na+ symporter
MPVREPLDLAQIVGLIFVVTSMLAGGMNLTTPEIFAALKDFRLVVGALLANFVLVPALAYLITSVIPLEQSVQIALIILATAAGAGFVPKVVNSAKGNVEIGGLMVLLVVVTTIYMPFVLPLLLPGVPLNSWDIAQSLIVFMVIPLALGFLVRSRLPERAAEWRPVMNKICTLALAIVLPASVLLSQNVSDFSDTIVLNDVLAFTFFLYGSLYIGALLGGPDSEVKLVLGVGAALRNVVAAILVTAQCFGNSQPLWIVVAYSWIVAVWSTYIGSAPPPTAGGSVTS